MKLIPNEKIRDVLKSIKITFFIAFFTFDCSTYSDAQSFWQATNGPQGGMYRDISSNLTRGKTYLLCNWTLLKGNGLGGNAFISSDGGDTWNEIDNGLSSNPPFGLAHSNVNGNLAVYTLDPLSPLSASTFNKIYYSNNDGTNWSCMDSTSFAGNLSIVLKFNPTADTLFAGQKSNGIRYSVNNGISWQTMNSGLSNLNIIDLEYGYQGKLYCCTDSINGSNGAKVFVKNGTTWTSVSIGLPNTRINDLYYDIATSTMYAGTANFANQTGEVYTSINGGTWTQLSGFTGNVIQKINTTTNGDPLIRSLDQGIWRHSSGNWIPVNSNLNSQKTTGITRDNSGNILLTNAEGIWKFNESLNNWTYYTNGIINSECRTVAFSQNGDLIVGTQMNGLYKSNNGGLSYMQTGLRDTAILKAFLYPYDGRMFAGNTNPTASHIFTSTDNGSSWFANDPGFNSLRTLDFAYNNSGKLFVGSGWTKPIHSSNDGINWTGSNWSTLGFSSSTVAIAVAIDSSNTIYIGVESDGVWRSTNGGLSFDSLSFTGGDVTDIKISPNQDVFVTHDVASINGGNLYRSTDGGNTWSPNLIGGVGFTNCIFMASSDSIYAGTSTGVWMSADTGSTWTLINSGLNPGNLNIHDLALSPDGYLYAGTSGNGIYRSVNKIKDFTLGISNQPVINPINIYPNPASEIINFSKPLSNFEVFNNSGQKLIEMAQSATSLSVKNLSNGVYFIRTEYTVMKFIVKH